MVFPSLEDARPYESTTTRGERLRPGRGTGLLPLWPRVLKLVRRTKGRVDGGEAGVRAPAWPGPDIVRLGLGWCGRWLKRNDSFYRFHLPRHCSGWWSYPHPGRCRVGVISLGNAKSSRDKVNYSAYRAVAAGWRCHRASGGIVIGPGRDK